MPRGAQLVNFAHAALAEVDVADRESFIDQENFRIQMDGDGESEANDHAARIGLDRLVDEIADLGEGFDFGEIARSISLVERPRMAPLR